MKLFLWVVAVVLTASCFLSGGLCQSDNYLELDDNYHGEVYYSEEEEPYVDPRSQNPSVVTRRPAADVNYEITLEEGTDGDGEGEEEDSRHPALRKYATYDDPKNNRAPSTPKTTPRTTPKPTTRRTTAATTTTTTTPMTLRTTPPRRASTERPRGGQTNSRSPTTERNTNAPPTTKRQPEPSTDEGDEEKGNLLVDLDYRKEDRSCPDGQVLDVYGYCREIFREESRDWNWWINIRNFIFGSRDSGYLSSY